jgi:hemolysin activation/secretion protein
MRLPKFGLYLALGASLLIGQSLAQSVPPMLPGAADPGRLPDQLRIAPPVTSDAVIEIPELGPSPVVSPEGQKKFVLRSVSISGAKTYSVIDLVSLYQSYVGKEVTISDLQRICNAITKFYRDRGYFLSRAFVPQQTISDGVVRLVVLEGYVSQVRFEYADGLTDANDMFGILDATKNAILAMRPLNGAELETRLLLLSDLRGVKATSVMENLPEGTAAPGAIGMVIKLSKVGPSVQVKSDNSGSRYNGPYSISATGQISPGLFAFDSLSATAYAALPDGNVKFGQVSYSVPLNASGTKVSLSGQYSSTQPKYTLEPYDIDGTFYKISLAVSQAVVRSRSTNLILAAMFDYSDSQTDAASTRLYHDSLRIFRVSADFNHADAWDGTTMASVIFSQGLDILGARKTGSLDISRRDGHSDFTKVELMISRLQYINEEWTLYAAGSGQFAAQSLLVSETFGYGGQVMGRAYDPSELIGDNGVSGSLELRYESVPPVRDVKIQPFAFYDIGRVWNNSGGMTAYGHSVGGGVRLAHSSGVNATLGVAVPLKNTGLGTGSNPRLLLQLGYSF